MVILLCLNESADSISQQLLHPMLRFLPNLSYQNFRMWLRKVMQLKRHPIRTTSSNWASSHVPHSSTITTTKVPVVITQITPFSSTSGHTSRLPVHATSALKPSTLVTVSATPQQHQHPKSLPTTTTSTSTTSMATPLSNSDTVPPFPLPCGSN